jgi:NitT/TauT family transport system ATP-binding protein
VSFKIEVGDFVALLRPSYCGSRHCCGWLPGLDAPDCGRIAWEESHAPTPGELGFVFQDATLLPWTKAEQL